MANPSATLDPPAGTMPAPDLSSVPTDHATIIQLPKPKRERNRGRKSVKPVDPVDPVDAPAPPPNPADAEAGALLLFYSVTLPTATVARTLGGLPPPDEADAAQGEAVYRRLAARYPGFFAGQGLFWLSVIGWHAALLTGRLGGGHARAHSGEAGHGQDNAPAGTPAPASSGSGGTDTRSGGGVGAQ